MRNGEWCIWKNINKEKNIKGSMGQQYPYSTKLMENIVVILCIYGGRDVLLLLCDDQDTKSESR